MNSSLFRDLARLGAVLPAAVRMRLFGVLPLLTLGVLLEALSIGAIPALLAAIARPSTLANLPWIGSRFEGLPDSPSAEAMVWISAGYFTLLLLKTGILVWVAAVQARLTAHLQVWLGDRLYAAYLGAPYEWHLQHGSAGLLRNLRGDTWSLLAGILLPTLDALLALCMIFGIGVVVVLFVEGPALWMLLLTALGLLGLTGLSRAALMRSGKVVRDQAEVSIRSIQDGLGAYLDATLLGRREALREVHRASLHASAQAQRFQMLVRRAQPYWIEMATVLGVLCIAASLIVAETPPESLLPLLGLVGIAAMRLRQLMGKFGVSLQKIHAARPSIPAIVGDLEDLEALESGEPQPIAAPVSRQRFERLQVERVAYSYPAAPEVALREASLTIDRGESVALVGSSACGKSTLLHLILGLLEPQSGRVLWNGAPLGGDLAPQRVPVGFVPQSIHLLDASLRANIAFGLRQDAIDEARLSRAIAAAGLEEVIARLPDGEHSVVGERGTGLSGGERQRVGIARALYPEPDLLVLDEGTSALDAESEAKILSALRDPARELSTLIVAHRRSSIENCDRIYLMHAGGIEAFGCYAELIDRSDELQRLLRSEDAPA